MIKEKKDLIIYILLIRKD